MKRHNHEQMLRLYQQWQTSGESKTRFALSCGIRPTTFYYWTRKFEQAASVPSPGFQSFTIEEPLYTPPGELMAVIQYPTGVRLELYSSFQDVGSSYAELLKTLTA